MADTRRSGPRVDRSSGPRISIAQPMTPPTQVQLGNDRLLAAARDVHIGQIRPDPEQPRKAMEPVRLRELAASIIAYGLLQPLVVRQEGMASDGDMRYVIIAGGRRYAAIQLAIEESNDDEVRQRLSRVPVVVSDSAEAHRRVLQLIENLQREDLNPVEEARALKEIMQLRGLTMDELATSIHRSQGYVDERLRLLRHEEIEAAVEGGLLTKSAGAAIASIPSASLREAWLARARHGEVIRPREIYASKAEESRSKSAAGSNANTAPRDQSEKVRLSSGSESSQPAPVTPLQAPSAAPLQVPVAPLQAPVAPLQAPVAPLQAPVAPLQALVAPLQAPSAAPLSGLAAQQQDAVTDETLAAALATLLAAEAATPRALLTQALQLGLRYNLNCERLLAALHTLP